ncbi:MAG: hypothetical protein QOG15_1232 [Solirubrobacteraceae bacterium]|nr:hypothetical protein [Solirubrobacteraceae bacterium]
MIPPGQIAPLRLEHSFRATPEEVFDAWTNPEVLQRWWATGPTQHSPGCEVDLRVGGRYLMQMQDDGGGKLYAVAGEYREVQRPHRLTYTWCWQGDGGLHPGHVSLVTVEFVADGERTTVVLEHSELASEESRTGHSDGWRGALHSLQTRIFSDDTTTTHGRS